MTSQIQATIPKDVVESLHKLVESWEEQKRLIQNMLPSKEELEAIIRHLPSKEELEAVIRQLPSVSEWVKASIYDDLIILAHRGWFVSMWDTTLVDAHSLAHKYLKEEEVSQCDDYLCAHFEQLLDRIEETAISMLPKRKVILSQAFNAHRNGQYALSIPALLAQAEGVGTELFGGLSVYYRKDKKRLQNLVQGRDEFPYWLLITSLLPINASEADRTQFQSPLNRHLVLHGFSTDYTTRINGCKAISWFQYILSFKTEMD
jgi:hypothetical protein